MNNPTQVYTNLKEPHNTGEDKTVPYLFILAWDKNGKRYAFGTNPHMLTDRDDAERFKTCDLSRYPVGNMKGFHNRVVVIQTLEGKTPIRMNVDEALRIYDSRQARFHFEVVREPQRRES